MPWGTGFLGQYLGRWLTIAARRDGWQRIVGLVSVGRGGGYRLELYCMHTSRRLIGSVGASSVGARVGPVLAAFWSQAVLEAMPMDASLLTVRNSSLGVRGVFARERIAAGVTVFSALPAEVLHATDELELSVALFCHAAVAESSPWHMLISSTLGRRRESLYESITSSPDLQHAPHSRLESLLWSQTRPAGRCLRLFESEADGVVRAKLLDAWSRLSPSALGMDLWLWSVYQARSRGFRGRDADGNDGILLPSDGSLFNHGGSAANVVFSLTESGGMTFRSVVAIDEGVELRSSYDEGRHSILEWLRRYEMVPDELGQSCRRCAVSLAGEESTVDSWLAEACPKSARANCETLVGACSLDDLRCMHAYAMHRDVAAYSLLGMMLLGERQLDDAARAFAKAVALAPSDSAALTGLGTSHARRGRHEEAVACFTRALPLIQNQSLKGDVYHHLGRSLEENGRLKRAQSALKMARRLAPRPKEQEVAADLERVRLRHAIKAAPGGWSRHVEREARANAGGIELAALVALARDGTDVQKEQAVGALWHHATDANKRVAIAQAGGIEALVSIVLSGTPAQKEHTAGALMLLALDADHKVAIAEVGGIAPLVALARGGTDSQMENAVGALANLAANNAANKVAIAEAGGIEALKALTRDGTAAQKQYAAVAMKNLGDAIAVAVSNAGETT